jgi:PAS domain S-box-containing protein
MASSSPPEAERELAKTIEVFDEWRRFIKGLPMSGSLRPAIASSWQRSLREGADPVRSRIPTVSQRDLEKRMAACQSALEAARIHLAWMRSAIGASARQLVFVDVDGIALHCLGEEAAGEHLPELIRPGNQISEAVMGTNGAGTALATRVAVDVDGPEHFCSLWHAQSSSGAPVHGPDGALAGAVHLLTAYASTGIYRATLMDHVAFSVQQELKEKEITTHRERAKACTTLELEVTRILAEASNLDAATSSILEVACRAADWDVAELWFIDEETNLLRCGGAWQLPSHAATRFDAITRVFTFPRGVGLPGRVWMSGEPAWIADVRSDPSFLRADVAAQEGLRSGFGFPIRARDKIIGVLCFFSFGIRNPDLYLTGTLTGLAAPIGKFVERIRSEEHARFQAQLLDAVGQAVAATDLKCTVTYWNQFAEKLFGYTSAQAVGRDLAELIWPAASGVETDPILPRICQGQSWFGELFMQRRDGTTFPALVACSPVRGPQGTPIGLVTVLSNISHLKELERDLLQRADELAQKDRLKDEFLSVLAHELRNPLAPILHAIETMRLGASEQTLRSAQEISERQVKHLSRLVDDLLDVSRITRGVIDLKQKSVDLGTVVQQVVQENAPLTAARGQSVGVHLPKEPICLDADSVRIAQVVTNLLTNSAKYTQPGGSIDITVAKEGPFALIRVKDNGCGIEPDLLPHVFELFVQAPQSSDHAQGGLGIGLTLVRRLVQLHGGTVEAHSAGPGRGSEFVVRLPAPGDLHIEHSAEPPTGVAAYGSVRVLVVDDNEDAAETLTELLNLRGHRAWQTNDGPAALEALERCGSDPPDVVLLDIGLPGMDGYDVARRIRAVRRHENRPVLIALTGYGQEKDRLRSREAGFAYHLVKPIDLDALERVLEEAMRKPRRFPPPVRCES